MATVTIDEDKKLIASDAESYDSYGYSSTISAGGTTMVVGSYQDDDTGSASGSVYIYTLIDENWEEIKVTASDGAKYDYFGKSVDISADGTRIVVGAFGDDDNDEYSGSAYIYTLVGEDWEETKLFASDAAKSDYFGASVAISADANHVAIGAYMDDDNGTSTGSVYIYTLSNDTWEENKITASDANDYDYFGKSIDLSSDGTSIVVGAYSADTENANTSGKVYIYKLLNDIWEETIITAEDKDAGDTFGMNVGMSVDGNSIVVGAPDDDNGTSSGSVYLYE